MRLHGEFAVKKDAKVLDFVTEVHDFVKKFDIVDFDIFSFEGEANQVGFFWVDAQAGFFAPLFDYSHSFIHIFTDFG